MEVFVLFHFIIRLYLYRMRFALPRSGVGVGVNFVGVICIAKVLSGELIGVGYLI